MKKLIDNKINLSSIVTKKLSKQDLGDKAPQLSMDMLGNQRITWKLANELAIDEALDKLEGGASEDESDND